MKPSQTIALTATFLLAAFLGSCATSASRRSETSAPMIAILEAAKHSDTIKFKEAYSSRIRQESGQQDWSKNLREAKTTLNEKFGDYQINDFGFAFEGDDQKGKLGIFFKSKPQFTIAVVKEAGTWRLDER